MNMENLTIVCLVVCYLIVFLILLRFNKTPIVTLSTMEKMMMLITVAGQALVGLLLTLAFIGFLTLLYKGLVFLALIVKALMLIGHQ